VCHNILKIILKYCKIALDILTHFCYNGIRQKSEGDVSMNNKIFGYARISTKEQCLGRQLKALNDLGISDRDIIVDKASGKDVDGRAGYLTLRNSMLRSGDTLVVKSLDRLSRNKADIKVELEHYKANGIRLKVIDLPTTMIDYEGQEWVFEMVNNILIEVLGTIAEQERETIRQRQAEGIAVAKESGKVTFGRPRAKKPENWDSVIGQWQAKEITARKAMEMLDNMKPNTFYRLLKVE